MAISYSQFVLQFLTLLRLFHVYIINISRHIKITSVVLNFEFVTENFVAISSVKKIVFWILNFAMEISNISLVLKNNVFVRIAVLKPQSEITNLIS